jgi:Putative auto-transporter adhesin, head GIN domain
VSGRQLALGPEAGVLVRATRPIHYTLTVRQLSAIRMNGAGSIRADGVKTELLQFTLNGGARAELEGAATRQDVLIADAADYRADRLTSKEVAVEINGAGTVLLNTSDRLDATINGAGTVEYIGTPRVTKSINGLGTVRRRG